MIGPPGASSGVALWDFVISSGAGGMGGLTWTSAGQLFAAGLASQTVLAPGVAVAVLVIGPPWKVGSTVTAMVKVATPNGCRVRATLAMFPVPPAVPQLEPVLAVHVHEALTRPAGMGSWTVAAAVVVAEVLVTSTV